MKRIGLVTSEVDAGLIADDRLVLEPLRALGITAEPVVWDRTPAGELTHLDALVFRSCWNYHRKPGVFREWLQNVRARGIRCFNPVEQNLKNLDKRYLLELSEKGAAIPQTLLLETNEIQTAEEAVAMAGKILSPQVVIKPAISLNGENTHLLDRHTDWERLAQTVLELGRTGAVLIQEYIPEIKTRGEISLVYFNKQFSHALCKTPKEGEFRIHSEHGGTHRVFVPDAQLREQADRIVNMVDADLLFCRVDLVPRPQGAVLIELEIMDPMLFLGLDAAAPDRFARAIASVLA